MGTFIGIDLAWRSARNPSGAAVIRGNRLGAELAAEPSLLRSVYCVLEFVRTNATENTVVAIDAPLVITNSTGQRECETAVGVRYGSREASCHTSNLQLYPNARSVELARALGAEGCELTTDVTDPEIGRVLAEVYPHAAMVALWNLPKTIKYKKGRVSAKRTGLSTLRTYIKRLATEEPPLRSTDLLCKFLGSDLSSCRGRVLKDYEDCLDALFCAYLAYYFWYWRWQKNELFGDIRSGYILNPKLATGGLAQPV